MEENDFKISRRRLLTLIGASTGVMVIPSLAATKNAILPQPYFAAVNRALVALAQLGSPIGLKDVENISELAGRSNAAAVESAEEILDRYTLLRVSVEADGYANVALGGASKTLVEQGWCVFLVRVSNDIGIRSQLKIVEGSWATGISKPSTGAPRAALPDFINPAPRIAQSWYRSAMYEAPPIQPMLSGAALEYRVVQLYSRDRGQREAELFFVTSNDQSAEFRAKTQYRFRGVRLIFDCLPSNNVVLHIRDSDGLGCMASLTIKDKFDRIYPLQAMRLAPDMYFHAHVYRGDGETVRLPDGQYTVESTRGPEYLRSEQAVTIKEGQRHINVQLKRWIDPVEFGWYSGDVHIHAGGCAHYETPTEGVSPETMIRHVRGEGLAVGEVLTWGPSWYYQKQFFKGHAVSPPATLEHPRLQRANNASLEPHPTPKDDHSLLRYDLEISGFPSSHCGHLILLRLKEQDYPGTQLIEDWPSWNLPILQWARGQGAVVGYAHCGLGMEVDSMELPNYGIPPMDGVGTQEAIVDVAHGVVDFLAGCNTVPAAELNAWYHLLNCGFRLIFIGETDYPCITGERPGVGRTYVRLEERPIGNAGYEAWIRALQKGKVYCGDGRSHFLVFKVNDRQAGEKDVVLQSPGSVTIEALVAARLEPNVPDDIQAIKQTLMNGWHLEHARIGTSREVPVELLVNGIVVERVNILADGIQRLITFTILVSRSSWVALRILPSSHTYPVFVQVASKPVRASRRSARWCRSCVDKVWEVKSPFMRESERPSAAKAFDYARQVYESIALECETD